MQNTTILQAEIIYRREWNQKMFTKVRFSKLRKILSCVAVVLCLAQVQPSYGQGPFRFPGIRPQTQVRKVPTQQAFPAFPGAPGGLASNTLSTQLASEVDKHFEANDLPGLVVLYARDGMLTFKRLKGHADVANNVKMTENHVTRLNSVSKLVGGALMLELAEQGKINPKAKVKDYISEIPAHHTSRVIDTYTCRSGVRHYGGTKSPQSPNHSWGEDDFSTARDAIEMFWHDPLAQIVGEYKYSSFGYVIGDACVEQATGQAYRNVLKNTFSNPHGIPTLAIEELDTNNPKRVKYYTVKNGQNTEITPPKKEWTPSGGGMECSGIDLLKFGIKLGDKKILNSASLAKMMKRVTWDVSYAVGCNVAVENGYHVMAKNGSAEGSNAYMWMVPERRMVMVVLANRDGAGVTTLGKKLRSIILGASSVGGSKPDLIVENFKRTAAPAWKSGKWEIPVSFNVVNQGKAGASVDFVNSVRVNNQDRWTGFMSALPGKGQKKSVSAVVKISDPNKFMAGRTLSLRAYADAPVAAGDTSMPSYGRVKEGNDNNNTSTISVKIPGGLGLANPTRPGVPSTSGSRDPAKRKIGTRFPKVNIPTKPTTRAPSRIPTRGSSAAVSTKPDLRIREMTFDRSNSKKVIVVIGNAGKRSAPATKLRLTVRKIGTTPSGRMVEVATHGLAPGQSTKVVVDASKILPRIYPLKATTFRLDVDASNVVSESDEKNNLKWHNL